MEEDDFAELTSSLVRCDGFEMGCLAEMLHTLRLCCSLDMPLHFVDGYIPFIG